MTNATFAIRYDAYDLRIDRKALTWSLDGWAEALSLGWIEVEARDGSGRARHDFADCRLVSLSEKMGAQGKRILFGLDAPGGAPIDLYFTCGPKEIQLVVEASRDSRSHRVVALGLLPGLLGEGGVAPTGTWMPVAGACNGGDALALLWDSPYARLHGDCLVVSGDPERRRVDLRLVPLPGGDALAVARAYREKLVRDGRHVTLRKKARRAPALDAVLRSTDPPEALALTPLPEPGGSRWEVRDAWEELPEPPDGLWAASGDEDESAPVAHVWTGGLTEESWPWYAAVYRDAVLAFAEDFPVALLSLSRLRGATPEQAALLGELHRDTFAAFLKAHRVRDDGIEEALYTDGTRVTVDRTTGAGVVHRPAGQEIRVGGTNPRA